MDEYERLEADFEEAKERIAALEEVRMTAIEERVDADLACGRHAAVLGELYRDRAWLRDPEAFALRTSR